MRAAPARNSCGNASDSSHWPPIRAVEIPPRCRSAHWPYRTIRCPHRLLTDYPLTDHLGSSTLATSGRREVRERTIAAITFSVLVFGAVLFTTVRGGAQAPQRALSDDDYGYGNGYLTPEQQAGRDTW